MKMTSLTPELIEIFESKIKKTSKCWNWAGVINTDGKGYFYINKKYIAAHRIAWKIYKGTNPPELITRTCGNKLCINPAHLLACSRGNSMSFSWQRQRAMNKLIFNQKVTQEQIDEIRKLYSHTSITQTQLAKQFSISQSRISRIINDN